MQSSRLEKADAAHNKTEEQHSRSTSAPSLTVEDKKTSTHRRTQSRNIQADFPTPELLNGFQLQLPKQAKRKSTFNDSFRKAFSFFTSTAPPIEPPPGLFEEKKPAAVPHSASMSSLLPATGTPTTIQQPEIKKQKSLDLNEKQSVSIAIIGPPSAGKTQICNRVTYKPFEHGYLETIEEYAEVLIAVPSSSKVKSKYTLKGAAAQISGFPEIVANVAIHDVGGKEDYWCVNENALKKCDGYLLVYDSQVENGYQALEDYFFKLISVHGEQHFIHKPIVVFENKKDELEKPGRKTKLLGPEKIVLLVQGNAMSGNSVQIAFYELIRHICFLDNLESLKPPKKHLRLPSVTPGSVPNSHTPLGQVSTHSTTISFSSSAPESATFYSDVVDSPTEITIQITTPNTTAALTSPFPSMTSFSVDINKAIASSYHSRITLNWEQQVCEKHKFVVLIFYSDSWENPKCETFLQRMNNLLAEFNKLGAYVCCITSESTEKTEFAKKALGIQFDMISDQNHIVARKHQLFTAEKKFPILFLKKQTKGKVHPAVLIITKEKGVVHKWTQPEPQKTKAKNSSPLKEKLELHTELLKFVRGFNKFAARQKY